MWLPCFIFFLFFLMQTAPILSFVLVLLAILICFHVHFLPRKGKCFGFIYVFLFMIMFVILTERFRPFPKPPLTCLTTELSWCLKALDAVHHFIFVAVAFWPVHIYLFWIVYVQMFGAAEPDFTLHINLLKVTHLQCKYRIALHLFPQQRTCLCVWYCDTLSGSLLAQVLCWCRCSSY